jgi:hypothetical protein
MVCKREIYIHEPQFLTWWEKGSHRGNAYQYNKQWKLFIKENEKISREETLKKGKEIMKFFGKDVDF